MDEKIIVTNRRALTAKYGQAGLDQIRTSVAALVDADAKRSVKGRLIFLDDGRAMRRFGGHAVTDATNPRQNKAAIDAIFRKENPDYLLILGAPDVVPHQDIANPLFDGTGDPDAIAYGDLPYACDVPYSRDIARLKGPTRVVGRLPDLTGAEEPSYLLGLLAHATSYETRDVAEYRSYFGLSAQSWRNSTSLSLTNIFGDAVKLVLAPPAGPRHAASRLAPLSHFVNCHGALADPTFYGEKGRVQPRAMTSDGIKGKIRPGTVAVVECCYGAELYNSVALAAAIPICQRYLEQGAYGYFGSSTISYGPARGNGAADLITQYFLIAVLDGASLGRAALLARQRFVQQTAELDPVDLKTLAQFSLLGDPSIHPARVESPTGLPQGIEAADANRLARRERRAKLRDMGRFLAGSKPTASRPAPRARRSPAVLAALEGIAREAGMASGQEFAAFTVDTPQPSRGSAAKTAVHASRYYVAVRQPRDDGVRVAAVAREFNNRIVGYRIYMER